MDFLDRLRERLTALLAERSASAGRMDEILASIPEGRTDLTDAENAEWAEIRTSLGEIDTQTAEVQSRIEAIESARAAQAAADVTAQGLAAHSEPSAPAGGAAVVRSEPSEYSARSEHSFFRDLTHRSMDPAAADRIGRSQREMEQRAGTTANVAGLLPPQHLIDLFAPIVRSGRITASLVRQAPLPAVGTSFVVSRQTTALAVAAQNGENTALTEATWDDTTLTFTLGTFGGFTEMSLQEIDRNVLGDSMIMADLMGIYVNTLNTQVLNGSGSSGQLKGLLQTSGAGTVTYTDASPTFAEFWPLFIDQITAVSTARQLPATAVIMAPRRWGWLNKAVDTTGRPLIGAVMAQNAIGTGGPAIETGATPVGTILATNTPVYVDPAMPINLGTGTNEDRIIVMRGDDSVLMEEDLVPYRVYDEPGSSTLTRRLVVAGYAAFTSERYPTGINIMAGTGLIL